MGTALRLPHSCGRTATCSHAACFHRDCRSVSSRGATRLLPSLPRVHRHQRHEGNTGVTHQRDTGVLTLVQPHQNRRAAAAHHSVMWQLHSVQHPPHSLFRAKHNTDKRSLSSAPVLCVLHLRAKALHLQSHGLCHSLEQHQRLQPTQQPVPHRNGRAPERSAGNTARTFWRHSPHHCDGDWRISLARLYERLHPTAP